MKYSDLFVIVKQDDENIFCTAKQWRYGNVTVVTIDRYDQRECNSLDLVTVSITFRDSC